jgi:membrane-associated phospholipid phosphatase
MTVSRPWGRACVWLLGLGPFFFLSYGAANWLASMHDNVGSVVFDWERKIPFVPWTIIPYWSIDVLYGISLFICTTKHELDTHALRLLTAQVIAVTCFILFPLTFTFTRPDVGGVSGLLFESLGKFDKPFNQAPSLHIALLVILWDRYASHVPSGLRWLLHAWFTLIGLSVLTTYQHHFIDIPTGALAGFVCLWIWPEDRPSTINTTRLTDDAKRLRLAAYYAIGGLAFGALALTISGTGLWLFWPAASLLLVAVNYAANGATGFQKSPNGRMSPAARWILAPYIAGAQINSRLWTRTDPSPVPVADGVSVGRFPSRATAASYATIIDLCAELPGRGGPGWHAFPMLDLITPAAEQIRLVAREIEIARAAGPLLVCCALGYGRSATTVAAWLLSTGRAKDVDAAIRHIQRVRPRAVLREHARDAIAAVGADS